MPLEMLLDRSRYARASGPVQLPTNVRLCLYVAGNAHHSRRAVENLSRICGLLQCDADVEVEVVDIFQQRARALADGVVVAPTLIRMVAGQRRFAIGDLDDLARVWSILALPGGRRSPSAGAVGSHEPRASARFRRAGGRGGT
jgi:hypothetical protein